MLDVVACACNLSTWTAGQDDQGIKASLGCTASLRATWATQNPVSKTKIDTQREIESESMANRFPSMCQILISILSTTKKVKWFTFHESWFVCVHVCICAWEKERENMLVGARRPCQVSSSIALMMFANLATLVSPQTPGILLFPPPWLWDHRQGLDHSVPSLTHLHWFWGIKPRSSGLCSKHITYWVPKSVI